MRIRLNLNLSVSVCQMFATGSARDQSGEAFVMSSGHLLEKTLAKYERWPAISKIPITAITAIVISAVAVIVAIMCVCSRDSGSWH